MAEINIEKMAHDAAKKAIQELKDNGVFVARWIPCRQQLPKDNERVLAYIFGEPEIMFRRGGLWNTEEYCLEDYEDRDDEPIAWMPLPKPYESEG